MKALLQAIALSTSCVVFLSACSASSGAKTEDTGYQPNIIIGGTEPIALAVGRMGGCTVVGTNLGAATKGYFHGLLSSHCFPKQALTCQDKPIAWNAGSSKAQCVNVKGGAGEGSGDFVVLELNAAPSTKADTVVASRVFKGDALHLLGGDGALRGAAR